MNRWVYTVVAVFVVGVGACRSEGEQAAEAEGAGAPQRDAPAPAERAGAPDAQFYRHVASADLEEEILFGLIDEDDDITVEELSELVEFVTTGELHAYLQGWITRMVERIKVVHPELASLPVPELILLRQGSQNAFVTASLFCVPLRVELGAHPGGSDEVEVLVPSFAASGALTVREKCRRTLAADQVDDQLRAALLAHLQSQVAGCRFAASPAGGIAVDNTRNCPVLGGVFGNIPTDRVAAARHIALPMTVDKMVVFDGLIAGLDDFEELAPVLAHELAHYLRGHTHLTLPFERSSLFYDQLRRVYGEIPPASADQAARADELVMLARQTSLAFDHPAARYHGRLYDLLDVSVFGTAPEVACRGAADGMACDQEYRALVDLYTRARRTRSYPSGPLSPADVPAYLELEARIAAFLATRPVRLARGAAAAGFNIDGLASAAGLAVDPQTLLSLDADRVFLQLSTELRAREAPAFARRDQIAAQGLARYTTEVQADEGIPELLTEAGLSPRVASATFLIIKQFSERSGTPAPLVSEGAAACAERRAAGWKQRGVLVPPVWGFPLAIHPSDCWRVFNLDQLMDATGRRNARRPVPGELAPSRYPALRQAFLDADPFGPRNFD